MFDEREDCPDCFKRCSAVSIEAKRTNCKVSISCCEKEEQDDERWTGKKMVRCH